MKKTLVISYPFNAGGQLADRHWWMGILKGGCDVEDYNSKDMLKKMAEENNWNWEVIRWHRNGTFSVIERSYYGD